MMKMMTALSTKTLLIACLTPLGCESGGRDTESGGGTDTKPDDDSGSEMDTGSEANSDFVPPTIRARITVPDDFDGVPESISVVFFESQDVSVEPVQFGDTIHDPEIGVGTPFELEIGQAGLSGAFFLAVVLYCEGGGDGDDLVPGVDWAGLSEQALELDPLSGEVDAGTIELQLFQAQR